MKKLFAVLVILVIAGLLVYAYSAMQLIKSLEAEIVMCADSVQDVAEQKDVTIAELQEELAGYIEHVCEVKECPEPKVEKTTRKGLTLGFGRK